MAAALRSHPRDPAGEDAAEHGADRDAGEQQREGEAAVVGAAEVAWAISGKSARGIPKTIAMMSTTKDISSTGWPRR